MTLSSGKGTAFVPKTSLPSRASDQNSCVEPARSFVCQSRDAALQGLQTFCRLTLSFYREVDSRVSLLTAAGRLRRMTRCRANSQGKARQRVFVLQTPQEPSSQILHARICGGVGSKDGVFNRQHLSFAALSRRGYESLTLFDAAT